MASSRPHDSLNLSDDVDVNYRKQSLIGQINTVLCRFGRLDPIVKNKCSAVAEMGDRLATIDIVRKLRAVPLWGVSWVPM